MTSIPAYSWRYVCNAHVVSVVVRRPSEPPIGLVSSRRSRASWRHVSVRTGDGEGAYRRTRTRGKCSREREGSSLERNPLISRRGRKCDRRSVITRINLRQHQCARNTRNVHVHVHYIGYER